MPEGPSIITLKNKLTYFIGKTIIEASGYADIDYSRLKNKKVLDVKSWGKHFFICLNNTNIEIHLRLFGSCMINKHNPRISPKLQLRFKKDELNFYVIDVKLIENLEAFDSRSDILADEWDPNQALNKLKGVSDLQIGDALLKQEIFSGLGILSKMKCFGWLKFIPKQKQRILQTPKKRT